MIDIPDRHLEVLRILHRRVPPDSVDWALTGSTSFALQGISMKVNDIDVQTDKYGAFEIERRFSEKVIREVKFSTSERIQSYFGALMIRGVEVEIMGDMQKKEQDGSWEDPIDVTDHRQFVQVEDIAIPVLDLEYEYRAALKLGRQDKACKIMRFLKR
ncbi:MAG: nucleotidyltransferase domain-containing protein [Candidatus Bipolaricaulota bacterium]